MSRVPALPCLALACSTAASLPAGPPGALQLVALDPFVAGTTVRVGVDHALPSSRVALLASTGEPDPVQPACPTPLAPVCLELSPPTLLLGQRPADPSGRARFLVRVPDGLTGDLWLQAASRTPGDRWTSDVLATTVTPPAVDLMFVVDITASWTEHLFQDARTAILGALDALTPSPGLRVGMTLFSGRSAWLYTPWTDLADPAAAASIRADWAVVNIASRAGINADPDDGLRCLLYTDRGVDPVTGQPFQLWPEARWNDFSDPPGGCYPAMPREYTDESGTDFSTGLALADSAFRDHPDPSRFRALVLLTDGNPFAIAADAGAARAADGYGESRWQEYVGPAPHTTQEIRDDTTAIAQGMTADLGMHTWVVSYRTSDAFLDSLASGQGTSTSTQDPTGLETIMVEIAQSIPVVTVQ